MSTDTTMAEADDDVPESGRKGRPAAGHDPAKRQQIIDGARRVFIEMGFDAASMNDITRAAGVSKGTIYVYFANKEELFEALIEEERGSIFKNLYEALEYSGDLRKTLIHFGKALSIKITSQKVVLAQRTVQRPARAVLAERAEIIQTRWGLPAPKWLRGFKPIADL